MSLRHLLEPGELEHLHAVADWLGRPRLGYVVDEIRRRHGDLRRQKRRARAVHSLEQIPPLADTAEPVPDQVVRAERIARICNIVQQLPKQQRRVTEMRMRGHSIKEVAAALGCTVDNVDYHIRKARPTLTRLLEGI